MAELQILQTDYAIIVLKFFWNLAYQHTKVVYLSSPRKQSKTEKFVIPLSPPIIRLTRAYS